MTTADTLSGAQGKFALFVASLFQRAGLASMQEFGELLAVFADTLADTDPDEAAILKGWAASIQGLPPT